MSATPDVSGNIGTRAGAHFVNGQFVLHFGDLTARSAAEATMRALVQHTYGSPDVLEVAAVPTPTPGPGQVRVRVAAASVNARDWHIMRGEPRLARLLDRTVFGRAAPRVAIRGTDFAGTVDAVGAGVTRWQPGDPVFGEADAALAEYVVASQELVAPVPPGTSFEQAAALPLAANTALMCLRAGDPTPGARLLINGASGGVGTFAIQLATTMGLHITAVCSARNAELARSLGADSVIDYTVEDFCAAPDRYDMVLDLVGNRSVRDLRGLVHPTGTLILSGGGVSGQGRYIGPLGLLLRAQLMARLPGPRIVVPQALPSTERLEELAVLVASGSVTPVIDRVFDLDHGADALRYLETEHARAKVIVTIHHADEHGAPFAQRPTDEGGSS
jgi:NADPH:quinone reductase-like Zn-dependent oxidoreductase